MTNNEFQMMKEARRPKSKIPDCAAEGDTAASGRTSKFHAGDFEDSSRLLLLPTSSGCPAANPKGIASSSPGLRAARYPGLARAVTNNPDGVASSQTTAGTQPRWGWCPFTVPAQGSAVRATLGWRPESLWDSRQRARNPVGNGKTPPPLWRGLPVIQRVSNSTQRRKERRETQRKPSKTCRSRLEKAEASLTTEPPHVGAYNSRTSAPLVAPPFSIHRRFQLSFPSLSAFLCVSAFPQPHSDIPHSPYA